MSTTLSQGPLRTGFTAIAVLTALFSFDWPAVGQVLYGSLVGTVTDASDTVVPTVSVTARNTATGLRREVKSDERGNFRFSDLTQGEYEISASAQGFRMLRRTGVQIAINTVTRMDVRLKLGEVTQTVTVASDAAVLQTEKADLHVDISEKQLTDLPIGGYRNYQSLLNLVPGATPAKLQNAMIDSPGRSLTTNVNGTSRNTNTTRIDGAISVFPYLPHHTLYNPPVESIEVVNVSTNSFDADQGLAGGAAVNVTTRSGTNSFHAVAFGYHNNSRMAARNFFYLDKNLPKNIQNQYGGTFGGPILKNRLFFFTGWEGTRQRYNFSQLVTVPTAEQSLGDFSSLGVTLYDPATGTADGRDRTVFIGNRVPLNRQSPAARRALELYPAPNLSGTANNYFASAAPALDRDSIDSKINFNASSKTSAWLKYSAMVAQVRSTAALGEGGGRGLAEGGGHGTGDTFVHVAGVGFTHIASPSLLFDANLGFSRLHQEVLGQDFGTNFGLDVLGIPGTNGPDIRQSGKPAFVISGYETLGNPDNWSPGLRYDNVYSSSLSGSWTSGRHNIRFGWDGSYVQMNQWQAQRGGGPRGQFTFNGGSTALNGGRAPNQFNSFADFLLGLPQAVSKDYQYMSLMSTREWAHGLFVRDQVQVTRRLTATLGLRWEYFPLIKRHHRGIERYDPSNNKVYIGGIGDIPKNAGITTSPALFAPRLGLAYRLGEKTVIRAGYGISIDPYPMARPLRDPYPVVVTQDFRGPNTFTPFNQLDQGIPALEPIDFGNGVIDIPEYIFTKTLAPGEFKRGYIQSFNATLQRQLPGNWVVQLGYAGTRSIRQTILQDINAGQIPGAGTAGQPLFQRFGRYARTQQHTPFQTANYNALQARLDHRFAQGLLVTTSYTWSKAIDWAADSDSSLMINIESELYRNRSTSSFDRTQVLQLSTVYELPFGRGRRFASAGWLAAIAGGWQVNSLVSAYSGTPFTVTASGASLNAPNNTQVADQVKDSVQVFGAIGRGVEWFDRSAFVPVTDRRLGNVGRNSMRGPGLFNIDLGLFRSFNISEQMNVQFRAESFNLTNTAHFNSPNSTVGSNDFGFVTSALPDQRYFRLALRLAF